MNNIQFAASVLMLAISLAFSTSAAMADQRSEQFKLYAQKVLGSRLFFDTDLSEPNGQSCASCHAPSAGQADPDRDIPLSEGVVPGIFGSRNTPPTGYAMYAPTFQYDSTEQLWIGGHLLDGRATGSILGDPLADQALRPFLGANEMGNPSKMTVVRDADDSSYKRLFRYICGSVDLEDDVQVDTAYDCIALSIAAFERTQLFGKFNSRYDSYLYQCIRRGDASEQALDACAKGEGYDAWRAARRVFTRNQWEGLKLFMGETNNNNGILEKGEGAACVACHTADWTSTSDYELTVQSPRWAPEGRVPPLFTDFTYDNVGIPKSTHPLMVDKPIDLGLGGREDFLDPAEHGKFKVPSLRNIEDTAPYGHNGFFQTLREFTHFYNTRDTGEWAEAEVGENLNTDEMGNLGLSAKQEKQIVKFMETLTDDGS